MDGPTGNVSATTSSSLIGVDDQRDAPGQERPSKRAAIEAPTALIVGEPVTYAKEAAESNYDALAETHGQEEVIAAQRQVPLPAVGGTMTSRPVWIKLTGEPGKLRGCRFAFSFWSLLHSLLLKFLARFLNDPEAGHFYMQGDCCTCGLFFVFELSKSSNAVCVHRIRRIGRDAQSQGEYFHLV